ncbi:MAG: hypothetical protein V8T43_07210 [Eubacteriales bacterium]
MYKFYSKNGTAQFYEHGVEIDGTVYGIHTDRDILRIKRRIVNDKFAETDGDFDMDTEIAKIKHTGITFEQPTAEQLEQIQAKTYNSMTELKQHVQSVMNGDETMSQDEINAMLMLQIAELKAGVGGE